MCVCVCVGVGEGGVCELREGWEGACVGEGGGGRGECVN